MFFLGPKLVQGLEVAQIYSQFREMGSYGHPEKKYIFGKKVGSGAGGTVYLGTEKSTQEIFAIKTIDMSRQAKKEYILMEIRITKELNHKNLVNFVDCFFQSPTLWVVMEYLAGE